MLPCVVWSYIIKSPDTQSCRRKPCTPRGRRVCHGCPGRSPGETLLQLETPPAPEPMFLRPGRHELPTAGLLFLKQLSAERQGHAGGRAGAGRPVLALLALLLA